MLCGIPSRTRYHPSGDFRVDGKFNRNSFARASRCAFWEVECLFV